MKQRENGSSTILIILMTTVVLIGVITTSTTVTLNQRKSSSNERAAYTAVLASDSGQETFQARSENTPYATPRPVCASSSTAGTQQTCYVNAYTASLNAYFAGLGPVTSSAGTTALTVSSVTVDANGDLTNVDVLSTSRVRTDTSKIIRSYKSTRLTPAFPHVPGAVTSYPGVSISGNSSVAGRTLGDPANTGLIPNFMSVTSTGNGSFLNAGTPTTVTVSPQDTSRIAQLNLGQYVQLPVTLATGQPGGNATFKYVSSLNNTMTLIPVKLPLVTSSLTAGTLPLTDVLNGLVSSAGAQLTTNALESFYPGDQVAATVAGVTYTTTVNAVNGQTLTTTGWPAGAPFLFPEGTSLIKSTNAVVTAGSYSGSSNQTPASGVILSSANGGQALVPSPLNNALFTQLLGSSPAVLKSLSTVIPGATFDGTVSGLTWVVTGGSINLNSQKLNGSGLLVIDGDLLINNNGGSCAFSGILVVRGNLDMRGNIEICGALIVEGAITVQGGTGVSGIDGSNTDFNGTGQKVSYDPKAILDALNGAGPYVFTGDHNWRQQ